MDLQELNRVKMWPFGEMSPASLAKIQEFPGYAAAKASRDVVKLWEFIRRNHLTNVYVKVIT